MPRPRYEKVTMPASILVLETEFIQKPFSIRELEARVERVLSGGQDA